MAAFEVLASPPDLPDFVPEHTGSPPVAAPRTKLVLPPAMVAAIEAQDWHYRSSNSGYAFFDRPGFWLRIFRWHDGHLSASVMPEIWQPGTSTFERYAPEDLAPDFAGRGAIAKATAYCEGLIDESEGWLAEIGIELDTVAARLWHGTGRGGYMTSRSYSVRWKCFL